MAMYNANNERIKRQYFAFLKEAKRQSEPTVDAVAKALARFEADTGYRDFKAFHHEQAIAFKRRLAEQDSQVTSVKLSHATRYATLTQLKRFFQWLAGQPGYKSRLRYSEAEYFNLSEKESRVATARRDRAYPTLEQVKHLIAVMPSGSEIERRDRALVAFTLLTGARDSAIASMKIKHVDISVGCVYQDAREVNTKFSKTFITYFFPVSEEVRRIVTDWVAYLRDDKLWGNDDPLFSATHVGLGETRHFEARGLTKEHWSSAAAIRTIFRAAFDLAGMPYFNPHSLRKTLVNLGETICKTPEDFKAWSQNLGHEEVLTTFRSYGEVGTRRQGEIISVLGGTEMTTGLDVDAFAKAVARELRNSGIDSHTE